MEEPPKKYVKKTSLAEFDVTINAKGGTIVSGKIVHKDTGEEYEFVDIYDMINHMQQKYDKFGYPQSFNKIRTWKE